MSALPRRSQRAASHLGLASLLAVLAVTAIGCSSNNSPSPTVAPAEQCPVHVQPTSHEPLGRHRRSLRDVVGAIRRRVQRDVHPHLDAVELGSHGKHRASRPTAPSTSTGSLRGTRSGSAPSARRRSRTRARSPATPCRARIRSAVRPGATGAPRRPPDRPATELDQRSGCTWNSLRRRMAAWTPSMSAM